MTPLMLEVIRQAEADGLPVEVGSRPPALDPATLPEDFDFRRVAWNGMAWVGQEWSPACGRWFVEATYGPAPDRAEVLRMVAWLRGLAPFAPTVADPAPDS